MKYELHMLPYILGYSIGAICFGLVAAALPWLLFASRRRRIQRVVDFISYGVTLIALGAGLLSVQRYEQHLKEEQTKSEVSAVARAKAASHTMEYLGLCPGGGDGSSAFYSELLRDDCRKLFDFMRSNAVDPAYAFDMVGLSSAPSEGNVFPLKK